MPKGSLRWPRAASRRLPMMDSKWNMRGSLRGRSSGVKAQQGNTMRRSTLMIAEAN
jgi:hypothetical protein